MMTRALKITAESMADCGVRNPIMLSEFSTLRVATPLNMAGMMAKYFATSLAIEKVVSAPRVISSCLPISTISINLVGFESRSTMLPASFAACVPGIHRHANVSLGQGRRVVGAIARHRDQLAPRLLFLNEGHLVFRRRLREKVINTGFARNRRRSQRVVAGDHDRLDAHLPHLIETLDHAALHDVFQVNNAERHCGLQPQPKACRLLWKYFQR